MSVAGQLQVPSTGIFCHVLIGEEAGESFQDAGLGGVEQLDAGGFVVPHPEGEGCLDLGGCALLVDQLHAFIGGAVCQFLGGGLIREAQAHRLALAGAPPNLEQIEGSITHGGEADAATVGGGAGIQEQVGATLVGLTLFGGGDELG